MERTAVERARGDAAAAARRRSEWRRELETARPSTIVLPANDNYLRRSHSHCQKDTL